MTHKIDHLKKVEDKALSCGMVGDCRVAVRPSVGRYKVCPVVEHTPGFEPYFSRGKMQIARGLLEGNLSLSQRMAEVLYQCTLCGNCKAVCFESMTPGIQFFTCRYIDQPQVFEAMRADLYEANFILEGHRNILTSIKNYDNPWSQPRMGRAKWAKGLSIKEIKKNPAPVLFFTGCTAAYDAGIKKVAVNTAELLKRAGVDFAILGKDERCCGSPALRIGNRALFEELVASNVDTFNSLNLKTIVTSCSGCYKTLTQDYPDIEPEVLHITQYIQRLLEEGTLKFTKKLDYRVTYHDPCHLGRHSGVFDAPRQILQSIEGLTLVEMKRIKENAWCCGAGGGLKSAYPHIASSIGLTRVEEARATGADILASSCPFCFQNLEASLKGIGDSMMMKDVVELVMEAL